MPEELDPNPFFPPFANKSAIISIPNGNKRRPQMQSLPLSSSLGIPDRRQTSPLPTSSSHKLDNQSMTRAAGKEKGAKAIFGKTSVGGGMAMMKS